MCGRTRGRRGRRHGSGYCARLADRQTQTDRQVAGEGYLFGFGPYYIFFLFALSTWAREIRPGTTMRDLGIVARGVYPRDPEKAIHHPAGCVRSAASNIIIMPYPRDVHCATRSTLARRASPRDSRRLPIVAYALTNNAGAAVAGARERERRDILHATGFQSEIRRGLFRTFPGKSISESCVME